MPFPALIRTLVSTHAVDGLFCTSGNNTITAGQILQEFANDRIALVGFDLSDASIALMRDGAIDILLDQKPDEHAYHAAKTLFQHLTVLRCNTSVQYMPLYIYSSECLDPD